MRHHRGLGRAGQCAPSRSTTLGIRHHGAYNTRGRVSKLVEFVCVWFWQVTIATVITVPHHVAFTRPTSKTCQPPLNCATPTASVVVFLYSAICPSQM